MTNDVPVPAMRRPSIQVGQFVTIKQHLTRADAENEARWFHEVPWATPVLLDICGTTMVMQTLPSCWKLKDWRPVAELHDLLLRLHAVDVHHRDVHPGNIVRGMDGRPRLIDWETAIRQEAPESYDLVGSASGVPDPERHQKAEYSQWWESSSKCSIEKVWGCGVPS
jgi:serine/threonine protein kinase